MMTKARPTETAVIKDLIEVDYRQLLERLPAAVYTTNRDGYITMYNAAAVQLWGREPVLFTDQWCGSWKRYRTDGGELPLHEYPVAITMREKKAATGFECIIERPDGTRRHVVPRPQPVFDASGNLTGALNMLLDVTDLKLSEKALRINELEFQNRELEQFAYAAAHDMKEPLRKIRFYTNLVFDNSGHLLPEKESEYLYRSINAASRMQTLIDDLLTYSKTSRQELEFKKVDLGKVMAEIQLSHYDTIREIGAGIETGNLPVIDGVPFQVSQMFDNLLSNALKYRHPDRQLHIRIFAEKVLGKDVDFEQLRKVKEYYKISIADNGIGFDAKYADKVFDLFQRLHNKETYTGTGIGLALCRRIVQNHKGFIAANGEEGKGATFTVFFPVGHPGNH